MYNKAADYIKLKVTAQPKIGIILGSGLGGLADIVENAQAIDYADIPGFSHSTAPGHKGRLVFGELSGKSVVCMQGRFHFYEGYSMSEVVFPVRVMKKLGVELLIVTNAAGGINFDYNVGDLMIIKDHINFMGTNPLIGNNADEFGARFPDMSKTYTPELREAALNAARCCGMTAHEGVYLSCTGPSYETPAEIRAFRVLGADAVGMSTVPEVITAAHCGMKVLAFSLITNMAAGVLDKPLDGAEVIEIGRRKSKELQNLVKKCLHNYNL